MDLREKEVKVRSLIEEKIEYGDRLALRQEELRKWDISPREISLILEKFEKEKRIHKYEVRPRVRVWTTLEYWKHPNLENLTLCYETTKRSIVFGQHEIPLRGKTQIGVCKAILSRPLGEFIEESDILDEVFGESYDNPSAHKRTVRDSARALNKKVERQVGKKDLFFFQGSKVRVNL